MTVGLSKSARIPFAPVVLPSLDGFVKKKSESDKKIASIVESNLSPDKKYSISQKENGKFGVNISPKGRKKKNVIYRFKNTDGECYVGRTYRTAAKRASEHMSSVNSDKDRGKGALYEAIRKGPDEFDFGILYEIKDGEDIDIDALEMAYIKKKRACVDGFNSNAGGGGGHVSKSTIDPKKVDAVVKKTLATFSSPIKKGKIEKKGAGFAVKLSPKSANKKNVIYVIKNTLTGERYVGKTMQDLKKRMYKHMSNAKAKDKDRGKTPLAEGIRSSHKHMQVGILYEAPVGSEGVLDKMEQAFIEHYKSVKKGYNANKGGGGGSAK